ncbi:hypothetical protein Q3G72_017076 [Acer saccharum]|nr:hypothetical protein Q3G72_017076 [Acer saccharum]
MAGRLATVNGIGSPAVGGCGSPVTTATATATTTTTTTVDLCGYGSPWTAAAVNRGQRRSTAYLRRQWVSSGGGGRLVSGGGLAAVRLCINIINVI